MLDEVQPDTSLHFLEELEKQGGEMKLLLDLMYENNIIGGGMSRDNGDGVGDNVKKKGKFKKKEKKKEEEKEERGKGKRTGKGKANGKGKAKEVKTQPPPPPPPPPPQDMDEEEDAEDENEQDYENHMIFDGPGFSVNFLHYLEVVRIDDREFDRGAVRESVYHVHLNAALVDVHLRDIIGELGGVVEQIIERLNECYSPTDLVRFYIENPAFYSPHSLGLMPLHQFNVFKVMELLENVLQSDEYIYLDKPIEIHVGVIRNPLAEGRNKGINYLFSESDDLHYMKSIVKVTNQDNLCLARSMVIAQAKAHYDVCKENKECARHVKKAAHSRYYSLINRTGKAQTKAAQKLQREVGLPADHTASFADLPSFERMTNSRVVVFEAGLGTRPIYFGSCDERQTTLYLLYVKNPLEAKSPGHFHVITKPHVIFGKSAFCEKCLVAFDKKTGHKGCGQCFSCKGDECPIIDHEKHCCNKCNRFMHSFKCNTRHTENGVCSSSHRCKKCSVFYKPSEEHVCFTRICEICSKRVSGVHFCYIRQKDPKPISCRYIYADFEADPTAKHHIPNLAVARWQCEHCVDSSYRDNPWCSHCGLACEDCNKAVGNSVRGGEEREVCMNRAKNCGRRGVHFFGDDAASDFCKFIFNKSFEKFTLIFHNGAGYDTYFIAKYIFCTIKKTPSVIYRGSKIVCIDTGKLRVIDSLNFLSFPLSQMPTVFGLKNIKKGTFPIFMNTKDFWDYRGPMPDKKYYGSDRMKPKAKAEFDAWYDQQRGKIFDFKKELIEYCEADVNILQESCNAFRSWLLSITSREEIIDVQDGGDRVTKTLGVDPLQYCTLASTCMAVYRFCFLTEKYNVVLSNGQNVVGYLKNGEMSLEDDSGNAIEQTTVQIVHKEFVSTPFARMPSCGFAGIDVHSRLSILWLEYESKRLGIKIKHARAGGEHVVQNQTRDGFFKLDGYHKDKSGKETCWELMGCLFHGCKTCYGSTGDQKRVRHPHTGESLEVLHRRTTERLQYLRNELKMTVNVIWECEFRALLKNDKNLADFADQCDIIPRLDPRDSFFGGRTNAIKLYHEAKEGKKIGYVDVCSLYPMVLKNDVFPVGIPEVIVDPKTTDIKKYFGIVQARVRPPRDLYHPVLPIRANNKLIFPLCSKCATEMRQEKCECPDDVRDLTGTWTTVCLNDAVDAGYEIIHIYEVYHFKERAKYDKVKSGLFSDYVNMFLKGKQEASGWPSECVSEQQKTRYIQEYEKVEGIKLDPENIAYNSGKRATNKLLLNSFWGKYGEKNNQRVHKLAETCADIFKVMCNPALSLKDMHVLSPNRCMLEYTHSEGFQPEMSHVNVFIAAFTTANARSRLFHVLNKLGKRVIYLDTDSCVYEYDDKKPNEYTPDMGDYLGQWTNELNEGEYITKFVSSGPKSYCFITNQGRSVTRLKGFTLNDETIQLLNFESIKNLVLFWADPDAFPLKDDQVPHISVPYGKIIRDKYNFKLFSREEIKKYRVTYSKRRLIPGTFDTEPYGYREQPSPST